MLQSRELQQLLSCDSSAAAGTVHLVYIALLRKLCSHPALLRRPAAADKQEVLGARWEDHNRAGLTRARLV